MRNFSWLYWILSYFLPEFRIKEQNFTPSRGCLKRYYHNNISLNDESFVCVCNSDYCDSIEQVNNVYANQGTHFEVFITSKDKYRLDKFLIPFDKQPLTNANMTLNLNRSIKFQRIIGFGGAITDSAGYNIFSLSNKTRKYLIDSYFDDKMGIEYNLLRVPVAGTDFSLRTYTYDDFTDDFELGNFSLAKEDLEWKISFIAQAKLISKKPIKCFASAWTAPIWMKTNNDYKGHGQLKGPVGGLYYDTWARYYLKFFQSYKENNISFWAMTAQNEPTDGDLYLFSFNSMGFTPESQSIFITENLLPTLKANGFDDLKIMIMDDQRIYLNVWPSRVASASKIGSNCFDGVALHWYLDDVVSPKLIDDTHMLFPDKWILATEASNGVGITPPVILGSFTRAERYAKDIIQDLNHWVTGWTDWNLALDTNGGPNWASNNVDSSIIVNSTSDEFYKQPTFYILGHFSKFLAEQSVRVDVSFKENPIQLFSNELSYVAFYEETSKKTSFILLNPTDYNAKVSLYDPDLDKYLNFEINSHSIVTSVWLN